MGKCTANWYEASTSCWAWLGWVLSPVSSCNPLQYIKHTLQHRLGAVGFAVCCSKRTITKLLVYKPKQATAITANTFHASVDGNTSLDISFKGTLECTINRTRFWGMDFFIPTRSVTIALPSPWHSRSMRHWRREKMSNMSVKNKIEHGVLISLVLPPQEEWDVKWQCFTNVWQK